MTIIRASCPLCGEVELTHHQVELHVCTNAPLACYCFTCPICRSEVRKPADTHVIWLLTGHVTTIPWHIPAEALEAHPGPPLCLDDLLDLHEALASL